MGQMSIVIGVTTVGTQRAMREIQLMEATVKKAQVSMMQLGRSMTQFASLPAGIFAGAALANFAKFEFSIAKITGLVGIADEQAKAWGKDVLNMSGDLGKGANELADALYYITSSGFKGAESMNILKISAQAAASGLGETKQVADIVTSAMNAYGVSALSAAEATNVLVMAVREGKGEPEDLTRAFATVIPISAKLGVQFHEVGGALAALTRLGMPAATAATYLRQTLFTLTKPSKQTRDALKAMGTSAGELRDSLENQGLLPTLRTLGDLTERFGEESMARVFPNIRAFMGVISLLQMDVAEVNEVFENTKNSSNALNDAFAAASETLKFKLNAAVAEGQSMFIKFGEAISRVVLPIVESLGRAFKDFGDWFGGLSKDSQNFIAKILAITIAGGPLLLLLSLLKAGFNEIKTVAKYIFTGGWIKGINNTTNALNNQNNAVNAQTVAVQRQTAVINANTSAKVKNNLAQQALLTGNKSKIAGVIPMPVQNKATTAVKASMVANQSLNKVKNQISIQAALLATEQQKLTILQNKYNSAVELQTRLLQASIHTSDSAVKAQQRYESSLGIADAAAKKNNLTVSMSRMVAEQRNIALLEQAAAQKMAAAAELQAIEVGQLKNQVDKQANAVTAASIQNKALNKKATLLQIEATKLEAAAVKARNAAYQESILRHQQLLAANNTTNKAIREHHKSLLAQRHAVEKSSVAMSGFTKGIKGLGTALLTVSKFILSNWLLALFILVPLIIKWTNKTKELTGAQKLLKEANDKVNESISSEKSKIETYLAVAKNENISKETRRKSIEEINKISPEYLGFIDEEAVRLGTAKTAVDAYNSSLSARLAFEIKLGEIAELRAKRDKVLREGGEAQIGFWDRIKGALKFGAIPLPSQKGPKIEYLQGLGTKKMLKEVADIDFAMTQLNAEIAATPEIRADIIHGYELVNDKVNALISKEKELKNVKNKSSKEYLEESAKYQSELRNTILLAQEKMGKAKNEIKFVEETAAEYKKLGDAQRKGLLTGPESQRFQELQSMMNSGFNLRVTGLNELRKVEPELKKVIESLEPKLKQVKEGGTDDFLGGTKEKLTKLQQLQKDLTDAFDGYQAELLIVEKTAELYGKTTGIAADKAKVLETVINLAGEAMANSIPIDKAKLEAVINLYNSLVKLDEEEKVRAKVLEDGLKVQMEQYQAWLTYINTGERLVKANNDLGKSLTDMAEYVKYSGGEFTMAQAAVEIYSDHIKNLRAELKGGNKQLIFIEILKAQQKLKEAKGQVLLDEYRRSLELLEIEATIAGNSFATFGETLSFLENAYKALLNEGIRSGEFFDTVIAGMSELRNLANTKDTFSELGSAFGELVSIFDLGEETWVNYVETILNAIPKIIEMIMSLTAATTLENTINAARVESINNTQTALFNETLALTNDTEAITANTAAITANTLAKQANAAVGMMGTGSTMGPPTQEQMLGGGMGAVSAIGGGMGAASGLGKIAKIAGNFSAILGGILGVISIISLLFKKKKKAQSSYTMVGMALGGIVPQGYPNDSYPAMLTSGEAVIPAKRLPEFERQEMDVNVTVDGVVRGSDIHYIVREVERRYKNTY